MYVKEALESVEDSYVRNVIGDSDIAPEGVPTETYVDFKKVK